MSPSRSLDPKLRLAHSPPQDRSSPRLDAQGRLVPDRARFPQGAPHGAPHGTPLSPINRAPCQGNCPGGCRAGCQPRPGLRIEDGTVVEYSSYGPDPLLAGVFGDPWNGTNSSYLQVPSGSTATADTRYLYRLVSVRLNARQEAFLVGYRQSILIGYEQPRPSNADEMSVVQIEQTTGFWRGFPDGNVSWSLTVDRSLVTSRPPATALVSPLPAGYSSDIYGLEPALIASAPYPGYVPLNRGLPIGSPIGSLGNFWELRSPFNSQATAVSLDYRIVGPATITFWASVRQTNPARPGRAAPPAVDGTFLPPEEQFLLAYPLARYRGVAGSILLRLRTLPC